MNLQRAEIRRRGAVSESMLQGRLMRAAFLILAAFSLLWPALLNGYPLLYPDSVSYLGDGAAALRTLTQQHGVNLGWMRSSVYSLSILLLHAGGNAWPVIAAQALAAASMLFFIVRAVVRRHLARAYIAVVGFLSLATGAAWFSSYLMPDIFGSLLYLAIALLVFAPQGLSRRARVAMLCFVAWGSLTHTTHMLVAIGVCAVLVGNALLFRERVSLRRVGSIAALLALALMSQLLLNLWLYRSFSYAPKQPAFLTARLIADGPARDYLMAHCSTEHWLLCSRLDTLGGDEDDFLWSSTGVMATSTPTEQAELRREEVPLLRATLRTYPQAQMAASVRNVWTQLLYFDLDNFDNSTWMQGALPSVLPGAAVPYARSLEARNAMPSEAFSRVQRWTVVVALLVLLCACCRPAKLLPKPLGGFLLVIVSAVLINAIVTGALSGLDARYEARVIWLVPLMAALVVLRFLEGRRSAGAPARPA